MRIATVPGDLLATRLEALTGNEQRHLATADIVDRQRHLRRALELSPGLAPARNNLGNLLASRGDIGEAAGHFRLAVKADPEFASAHLNLGMAMAAQADHQGAAQSFRATLELEPDNLVARLNLGMALAQIGDRQAAREHFEAVLNDSEAPEQLRAAAEEALSASGR